MRFNLVFCLALSLCTARISLAQASKEGTASLSGVVEGTDGPAMVYLVLQDANPTSYYDGYKSAAEKNGRFSFAYIWPGTYRIRVEAAEFMPPPLEAEGMEITLRADEKRRHHSSDGAAADRLRARDGERDFTRQADMGVGLPLRSENGRVFPDFLTRD
jgi:hypothetical protein